MKKYPEVSKQLGDAADGGNSSGMNTPNQTRAAKTNSPAQQANSKDDGSKEITAGVTPGNDEASNQAGHDGLKDSNLDPWYQYNVVKKESNR